MNKSDPKERIVFAISDEGTGDGVPVVILGIPQAAWDRIKNGLTETFDLNKAGLPVKLILFGGPDRATIEGLLKSASKQANFKDRTNEDFTIYPTGQKP